MRVFRRWKLAVIASVTAVTVTVTGTVAYAAQGGETGFTLQYVPGSPQGWQANNAPAVAISTIGTSLRLWRSADNQGNMWASFGGGNPYQLPGNTFDAPAVVSFGAGGFAMFHTGIDNIIYWQHSSSGQAGTWSGWTPVTNPQGDRMTTPFGVSVTSLGPEHQDQLYLVYRSNDSRRTILGQFFNGFTWQDAINLGGVTDHSPAVTWNSVSDRLFVAHTGTTNEVYLASSGYGHDPSTGWASMGGSLTGRPTIATMSDGNIEVAGVAPDQSLWYRRLNSAGLLISDWLADVTNSTGHSMGDAAITLVAFGLSLFAFIINNSGFVYEKTVTTKG